MGAIPTPLCKLCEKWHCFTIRTQQRSEVNRSLAILHKGLEFSKIT